MRPAQIQFLVLFWGWMLVRSGYGNKSLAVDLLCIAIVLSTAIASFWAYDRLWSDGPKRKLTTGILILLVTAVFLIAIMRSSQFAVLALDMAAVPIATFAFLYSIVAGGTLLSLTLLGSGCHQALQRRRYYRSLDRSNGS